MSDQLKQLILAAEARGDMETAKLAMAKLRDSQAPQAYQAPPRPAGPTQRMRFIPGAMPGLAPVGETPGLPDIGVESPVRETQMIRELPELPTSGLLSDQDSATVARVSPTLLTTTDPNEIADIVTSNFPDVAVTYDKDAQGDVFPILTNRNTGARAIVNKPGISGMDVLQTIGLGAAFTPAGRAATVAGAAGKAALTQGAIEAAQTAEGGDFDPEDIAIAGAAGAAGQKLLSVFKPRVNPQFINPETQLPTKEFARVLKSRDIDTGSLINDIDAGRMPTPAAGETPQAYLDRALKGQLERGEPGAGVYNLKLENGALKRNPLGDEALKQGFQKGDIASMTTADEPTKEVMRKMARLKRSIQSNSAKALDNRPTDLVGDEAMKRVNVIRGRTNGLRQELNRIAQTELRGRPIDTDSVAQAFTRQLDDLNIQFTPGQPIQYGDSLVSEDPGTQRVINSVSRLLTKGDGVDALDAHNVKRQLDNMIDFNKKEFGLTDVGNRVAKQVRGAINSVIRETSPEYARVNDQLSLGIRTLDDLGSALGPSTDLFSEQAAASVGQKLRRLLSNAESRANLDAAVTGLDDAATQLGGTFRTDLRRLVNFNKTLDDRFGATAKGSFQGEIESAMRSGPVAAAKNFAARQAMKKVDDLRGISEEEAFNTLEKILRAN